MNGTPLWSLMCCAPIEVLEHEQSHHLVSCRAWKFMMPAWRKFWQQENGILAWFMLLSCTILKFPRKYLMFDLGNFLCENEFKTKSYSISGCYPFDIAVSPGNSQTAYTFGNFEILFWDHRERFTAGSLLECSSFIFRVECRWLLTSVWTDECDVQWKWTDDDCFSSTRSHDDSCSGVFSEYKHKQPYWGRRTWCCSLRP